MKKKVVTPPKGTAAKGAKYDVQVKSPLKKKSPNSTSKTPNKKATGPAFLPTPGETKNAPKPRPSKKLSPNAKYPSPPRVSQIKTSKGKGVPTGLKGDDHTVDSSSSFSSFLGSSSSSPEDGRASGDVIYDLKVGKRVRRRSHHGHKGERDRNVKLANQTPLKKTQVKESSAQLKESTPHGKEPTPPGKGEGKANSVLPTDPQGAAPVDKSKVKVSEESADSQILQPNEPMKLKLPYDSRASDLLPGAESAVKKPSPERVTKEMEQKKPAAQPRTNLPSPPVAKQSKSVTPPRHDENERTKDVKKMRPRLPTFPRVKKAKGKSPVPLLASSSSFDVPELGNSVKSEGIYPVIDDLMAYWKAENLTLPPENRDQRLVRDERVLLNLRQQLFDRLPHDIKEEEVDLIVAKMKPVPERLRAVKEVLPLILNNTDFVKSEAFKLVQYLLRYADKDSSVIALMSELHEYYEEWHLAYQWAFLAWAIAPSSATAERVQSIADRVLSATSPLSDQVCLKAVSSPFHVELPDSERRAAALDAKEWSLTFTDRCYAMEAYHPYRFLATREIRPADVVMEDQVIAIAPEFDEGGIGGSTCIHCLSQISILDFGYSCPLMPHTCPFKFCSFDCFMKNGQLHSFECQFLHTQIFPLANETGFNAAFILLVVRVLLKAHIARMASSSMADPADPVVVVSTYKSYECETRKLRPELYEAIRKLSRAICHFFPVPKLLFMSPEDCDDLIIKMHTHVIPINYDLPAAVLQGQLQTQLQSGLVLGVELAQVLHSCIPNCHVTYQPSQSKLRLTATATILPEEPLSYSLITDLYTPVGQRKNLFASWKVLDCTCGRCRDPSEGSRFVEGLRCRGCIFGIRCPTRHKRISLICDRDVLPRGVALGADMPPLEDRDWECTHCGILNKFESTFCNQLSADWIYRYRQILQAFYLKAENRYKADPHKKRLQLFVLFTEAAKLAHPNHYIVYNLALKLCASFRHNPKKSSLKALEYLRLAFMSAKAVLPPISPDMMVLYYLQGLLQFECLMSLRGYSLLAQRVSQEVVVKRPLFRACWLAACLYGKESAEWRMTLHRLRLYFKWTNENDKSALADLRPNIGNEAELKRCTIKLWPDRGAPDSADLRDMMERDPTLWWFAACRAGDKAVIKGHLGGGSLRERNAWIRAIDYQSGYNCLGVAAIHNRLDLMKYLTKYVQLEDLLIRNEHGLTLIALIASLRSTLSEVDNSHEKVDRTHSQMIKLVLHRTKELLMEGMNSENSHPWLLYRQEMKVSYQLLAFAQVASHEWAGEYQAVHYAAVRNKVSCAQELLRLGVAANATNKELATPLHLAAYCGHRDLCLRLIQAGSRIVATNYRGETPLMLACFELQLHTIKLLVEAGSDIYTTSDITGITCLHAVASGVTKTFRIAFFGRQYRNDPMEGHLAGFNPWSLHHFYEIEETVNPSYASIPVVEAIHEDLILFPDELKRRLDAAIAVVEFLRSHKNLTADDPEKMEVSFFGHSCREGFTAAEFLLHQWEAVQEVRESLLSGGRNIRLMNCTYKDKAKYMRDWLYDVSSKIYHLAQILKPYQHDEPTSLQLRKLTGLGHRGLIEEVGLEEKMEADVMQQLITQNPRQWDAKQRAIRTPADDVEDELAKVKEEALRKAAAERDQKIAELKAQAQARIEAEAKAAREAMQATQTAAAALIKSDPKKISAKGPPAKTTATASNAAATSAKPSLGAKSGTPKVEPKQGVTNKAVDKTPPKSAKEPPKKMQAKPVTSEKQGQAAKK